MHIGFIGLGKMGRGVASNLLKAGYAVTVYDVDPLAVERLVVGGARAASNVQEMARGCGPWILAEDYAPRFSIDLTSKDLRLAVAMARARNAEPRFGALAYETFRQAQVQGLGVEDSAAVYKVFQRSKDGGGASEKH